MNAPADPIRARTGTAVVVAALALTALAQWWLAGVVDARFPGWGRTAALIPLAVLALGLAGWTTLRSPGLREVPAAGRPLQAERWASAAPVASAPMAVLDTDGTLLAWNDGAARLLGLEPERVVGRGVLGLFPGGVGPAAEVAWLLEQALRGGGVQQHETTWLDGESRPVDIRLNAWPWRDPASGEAGIGLAFRDITDERRRERDIRDTYELLHSQIAERTAQLAEKVEALGRANQELTQLDRMRSEFVSLVSHQIRAPLTNIRGAVTRMQGECAAGSPACERLILILHDQIARLDQLVEDVLSASHVEAGDFVVHPEPVSVAPVIRRVLEASRAGSAGRRVRFPDKPGMPLVLADRDRLGEILANYLDNAHKHTPPGEDVVVQVRADEVELVISVRDYGPGLDESELDRVFEKFYRSDSSDAQTTYGHGLGLYVCRLLAEAQGGRVWAENHPEGGAVFSLALPVWRERDDAALDPAD